MIQPMGARALVKRLEAPPMKSEHIIIPDTISGEKPTQFAVVVAIGKLKQGGFKPGDTVVLSDFSGAPCKFLLEGEWLEGHIVDENDVLMVIEGLT